MYELKDSTGKLVEKFETPEKAMAAVPQVDDWQKVQSKFSAWEGWDTSTVKPNDPPHYTITG